MHITFRFSQKVFGQFCQSVCFFSLAWDYHFCQSGIYGGVSIGDFIAAVLSGILTTDVLKVLFAKKLKPFIQPHLLAKIYKIIGVILLVFASRLLWFAFFYKQIAYTGNFGKLYFNENGLLIRA